MTGLQSIVAGSFIAVFAALSLLPVGTASAKSASLSITPTKKYTVNPGKSIKDTLVIRNLDAKETLDLTLRVVDFTFNDDGGTPRLMLGEDDPQTTWSLKPFLTVPKTVSIPPKNSKTVDMSIAIPQGQGAGSFYSAVVYSSGTPDGGNVGLSASGVTLIFTQIPGKVKEDLKVEQFGAYRMQSQGGNEGFVYATPDKPYAIAYKLKNNGNVTESPTGSITVKDIFGREQVITDVNPNESLALIGQSRTFTACLKIKTEEVDFNGNRSRSTACTEPSLWPGYYSLSLDLYYGQNGNRTQQLVSSGAFWYLPWWFVFVMLVLLLILAFVVWKIVRFVRTQFGMGATKNSKRSSRRK